MARGPKTPAGQLTALLVLVLLLGTGAQWYSPTRIPWREQWSTHVQTKALKAGLTLADTAETRHLAATGAALLLDARSMKDYNAGRIPGALSFPDSKRTEFYPLLADLFTPDQRLLVYCSGQTCDESLQLCLYLRDMGHTNLILYVGGFSAWKEAGLPVER